MARRRRTRDVRRFRRMALAVVTGVQVPAVAALGWLTGYPVVVALGAAAVTTPYLTGLRNPFDDQPKSALYRYVGLWPFFAWWTSCLVFAVIGLVGLAAAVLTRQPVAPALTAAGIVSLWLGVGATWRRPRLQHVELRVPELPDALDGYKIAQLSDVHCGSFTPGEEVARWVERLNALDADLVAVTGDLITSGDRHTEAVARALSGLRGRDGVFACMGNHDYFTDGDAFAHRLERAGLAVLRNRGVHLTSARLGGRLFVAGADDTWTGRDDVERALADRLDGGFTLLLAHDPNLFPLAAANGATLTLSGHTHGGQLAVPGLAKRLTLARIITRFTQGLYEQDGAFLYVNRGAGTTGPPIRLGVPAELTLITLRRA